MEDFNYVRPMLEAAGKKTADFLSWLNDKRKNHKALKKYKGKNLVQIKRNGGGGAEMYIHEALMPYLKEYLTKCKEL